VSSSGSWFPPCSSQFCSLFFSVVWSFTCTGVRHSIVHMFVYVGLLQMSKWTVVCLGNLRSWASLTYATFLVILWQPGHHTKILNYGSLLVG
jgi:hypothetical protein